MRLLFTLTAVICTSLASAQLLHDPTTVYDQAGSGALYDIEEVYDLHVNFYDDWYHDTLINRWYAKDENRLPASMDMGPGIHYDYVGIKYKGNSTFFIADAFGNPKVPYNIDVNYYVGGQKWMGYKKLKLANALFDPTFTKEAVASMVYRNYLPSPQVSLIRLTVNGNYLGCMVNTESIGKQFLEKHFKEKDGTFVKCEPIAQFGTAETFVPASLEYEGTDTMDYYESYEIKSDSIDKSWNEFIEFIDNLNNNALNIDQWLNVDRLLWYFAVTTVLPNEDAYNTMVMHNYYVYKTADGKFQIIPWDLSETFCGAMVGQLTKADHYERDPAYGYTPYLADHPLVFRILSQPYYLKRYLHHVRTVMAEYYDQTLLKDWAVAIQANAYDAVDEDPNKFFSMSDYTDNVDNNMFWFTTEIAGMVETIDNRRPYLEAHPEVMKVPPTIVSVDQNIENPASTDVVYISAEVTGADNVYLKVTNEDNTFASSYTAVEMLDDGLGGDLAAGDNIYTAAVPFSTSNDHIKYYVEATNTDAMALMPERAEYFYYHYYVDQVVSVAENQFEIGLYPNPAVDFFTIEGADEFDQLDIFRLDGKLVDQITINSNKLFVDCNRFEAGTYLLRMSNESSSVTKKIIIR